MQSAQVSISFIVPTIGRSSLRETIRSIETRPSDEILVVGNVAVAKQQLDALSIARCTFLECKPGGDFGHSERNFVMPFAKGSYCAHIDDDDIYTTGHRLAQSMAMLLFPDRPVLFKMRYPNGITLWQDKEIRCGNVGTPMMLIPNVPAKLGTWMPFVGGDCAFLESSKWLPSEYVW